MSNKLLIRNLSGAVSNLRLEQLFARYGRVSSAQIVIDEQSGLSQWHGHVQMSSDADAQRAMAALQGHLIDGRAINISPAPSQDAEAPVYPRPRYGNGRSGGGGVRSGRRDRA
jgi:RNA recognition motif-containing protein